MHELAAILGDRRRWGVEELRHLGYDQIAFMRETISDAPWLPYLTFGTLATTFLSSHQN
ncbi:hypothetical protein FHT86_007718 [Rhizobium sp. BK313]|nr:hypothetical protein [Rhizobium sp. BK313]